MQLKSTQNSWSCNKRSVTNSTIQLASKVRTFPTKSTFQVSLKPNTPSSNFYRDYNQTNNIDPENPAHRSNSPWKRKKRQLSIKIPARESKCWRRRKTAKKVRRPISSAQFRNHSRSKNNREAIAELGRIAPAVSKNELQRSCCRGWKRKKVEKRVVWRRDWWLTGVWSSAAKAMETSSWRVCCGWRRCHADFGILEAGDPGPFYKRTNLAFFIKKYIKFKIL